MATLQPLWTPSEKKIEDCTLTRFARFASQKTGLSFNSYDEIHSWSCDTSAQFWDLLWDFANVVGDKGNKTVDDGSKMPGALYFPEARLNYAENLLKGKGEGEALVFRCEDKLERRVSWNELHAITSRFQQAFVAHGLSKGDRVAAMMPNMPETIAAMLAATSLGAIWSSCSPDFGEKGVLDRFGQIAPKVFIACDGYWYNGKRIEIKGKLEKIVPELGAELNVVVPLLDIADDVAATLGTAVTSDALTAGYEAGEVSFARLEFAHPL